MPFPLHSYLSIHIYIAIVIPFYLCELVYNTCHFDTIIFSLTGIFFVCWKKRDVFNWFSLSHFCLPIDFFRLFNTYTYISMLFTTLYNSIWDICFLCMIYGLVAVCHFIHYREWLKFVEYTFMFSVVDINKYWIFDALRLFFYITFYFCFVLFYFDQLSL